MRRWEEGFMVTHSTTVVTKQTPPAAGPEMTVKGPGEASKEEKQRENRYFKGHLRDRAGNVT